MPKSKFKDYEVSEPSWTESDPGLLGCILTFVLLVLTAVLWYYAAPEYARWWFTREPEPVSVSGVDVRTDGTIPGRRSREMAVVFLTLVSVTAFSSRHLTILLR